MLISSDFRRPFIAQMYMTKIGLVTVVKKKDMKSCVFYIRKKICPWEPRYNTVERLPGTNAVLQSFQVCACCSERAASSSLLKCTERQGYTQSKVSLAFTVLRWKKPYKTIEKMVNLGGCNPCIWRVTLCVQCTEQGRQDCLPVVSVGFCFPRSVMVLLRSWWVNRAGRQPDKRNLIAHGLLCSQQWARERRKC